MNKCVTIIKIDNVEAFSGLAMTGNGGQPFTFGAYNDGTPVEFINAYFWDIEFIEGYYTLGSEFARNKCITQKHDTQIAKWDYLCDVPSGAFDAKESGEPGILPVGNNLYLYISADGRVASPNVGRRISTDSGVTWSVPETCVIPGANANTYRGFEFQDAGKIYIIWQKNGSPERLYISESTDGLNFTNSQIWQDIPTGFSSIENSCVYWDSATSKWYGIIDGMNTGASDWRMVALSGNTLFTMTKMYDITSTNAGYIDGGSFLQKINEVWYMWVQTNQFIFCYKNTDITSDTWVLANSNPIFVLNSKWGQEQAADFVMCEKGGKCYGVHNSCSDTYRATNGSAESVLKYDGTKEQLVSDLVISVA
jgi:hypothetical protein